ncbi:Acyl-CoA N-acyltransferase domain-containing protein [Rozella allomycis CSF55]|uniref:Glycylpeptide N-tetradecanoyltransferase n=1 Tax=Rozella allomycis (strain CSF55) TaxID=988480 RepID=A0A075ASL9_ROZAC|nr:Acyl-CoA N-acyltransferase domain-containing protein [Rozella allomycis CSF55]|eukprot:EPZ31533.1 Acyl-CoA N-acyltransferase domain-containing protein [Rozella allomycis CSF55]
MSSKDNADKKPKINDDFVTENVIRHAKKEDIVKFLNEMAIKEQKMNDVPKEHKFWKTQPVMQEKITEEEYGPIQQNKSKEDIRKEPYIIPDTFVWKNIDLNDEQCLDNVYELLANNYVEDPDKVFRFNYQKELLKWAMSSPGAKEEYHVGVRVKATGKLVAFICAVPASIKINSKILEIVEINFLCVHKKLRDKRLAPVLIKEITRRANLNGIFQAVYTAGIVLPTPIVTCRYFHRSLNPKKLVETGFSYLAPNDNINRLITKLKLPSEPSLPGFRQMRIEDIPQVTIKLNSFLEKYKVSACFNEQEVKHWFLPVNNVVYSYVVQDPNSDEITSFISFYLIPTQVLQHPVHKNINIGYLFYYFYDNQINLHTLLKDALIMAKQNDFDVFNSLVLMDHNESLLHDLHFLPGDGYLNYYLFNYRTPALKNKDLGVVLF